MRNIRLLFLSFCLALAGNLKAETIFSFTLTSATTGVGTYSATGGSAECTKAMATGGSNEVTVGSQTFYKFNSSSAWNFNLTGNTLTAGDVLTFTCVCAGNKNGKGLIVNGETLTADFVANTPNTITYTVSAGDAFIGKTSVSVMRADSDIKFGTIEITRNGGGDDPTPGGGDDPTPGGGDDPTPGGGDTPGTGNIYAFWRFSGGSAPAAGSSENGTNMTVEFLRSDESKNYSGESAAYNAAVTDENMKSQGKAGVKMGANALYLKVSVTGGFKANDIVSICGYNKWKVSSSTDNSGDIAASVATGTAKGDYNIGSFTLSSDYSALYMMRAESSGTGICAIKVTRTGDTPVGPVISNDATLSALTYDGISVPDFSATKLEYEVELPAGTTTAPTVAATATDAAATVSVTPPTSLPGNATVTVTAEDGTTTKTYTISFTVASAAPKVLTATWDNIKGTANIDQVNMTITGEVTNGSSLSLTPSFTGNNIASWSPDTEQNFANGTIKYTFTSSTNETTVYAVTITEAPVVSTDATLSSLRYGSQDVPDFSPDTYTYNIELTYGIKTPPAISATPNNRSATVDITQAPSVPGTGKVEVTAEDGETKLIYTINYTVAVPSSGLTIHEPEIYEAKEIAGGYGGTLSVFGGREYEVYFLGRDDDKNAGIFTKNGTQIGTGTSETELKIDWLSAKSSDKLDGQGRTGADEFAGATGKGNLKMKNGDEMLIHIKGFDQFTLWAKDNNTNVSKGKYMYVYIDDVEQDVQNLNSSDGGSLRRYDISTGEHVIKVTSKLDGTCKPYGFSLRLAQEPRTKWLRGNDSTQVVNQTASITPITYTTKYNNIQGAETALVWDGPAADGIGLTKHEGGLSDTLILSGQANCQIGEYNYHIAAYYNGVEINRVSGKFTVNSSIAARSELDVVAYTGEEMDQIIFSYYALSPDSVRLKWLNGQQPTGIRGSGSKGKYIIGGTPTVSTGTYPYSITTVGGDTTFTGTISVITPNYGPKSVMYLCKNVKDFNRDAVYQALNGTGSNQWELIPRKQKEDDSRPTEQYANYKWILISEDADADNLEVLSIIQGAANLPVLNMKGFTYSQGRLGWGDPDNGAIDTTQNTKNKGTKLYIEQPTHPIFAQMGGSLKKGDSIQILSNYELNGLMPININLLGTYCLATAYTRDINDYYKNGELQTVLHEVPADMRNGNKYICLPMAKGVTLTQQGKNLLNGIVSYLLSSEQAIIELPELKIESFELLGVKATIDQRNNTISVALSIEQSEQLEGAEPTIKIADEVNTHVTTSSVPLKYALYTPKTYVVTDYINRRAYSLTIDVYDPEGIENVYEAGEWVNIFDIYGRKVATTNENIYTMDLPRGMYIIVTESGETLKIMR